MRFEIDEAGLELIRRAAGVRQDNVVGVLMGFKTKDAPKPKPKVEVKNEG